MCHLGGSACATAGVCGRREGDRCRGHRRSEQCELRDLPRWSWPSVLTTDPTVVMALDGLLVGRNVGHRDFLSVETCPGVWGCRDGVGTSLESRDKPQLLSAERGRCRALAAWRDAKR